MEINIKGNLLDLNKPKIMGILNVTPDSFFDGGLYNTEKKVDTQVMKMIEEGMDILDVGGYSSRPGAKEISINEEIDRVIPVVKFIRKTYPELILSVDTFRSEVARNCLDLGIDIINDISAGCIDKNILDVVAEYNCPYIMMHMKGTPQTMQINPEYENLIKELLMLLLFLNLVRSYLILQFQKSNIFAGSLPGLEALVAMYQQRTHQKLNISKK